MWIKRFRSSNLEKALEKIRSEFGSDALILSRERVRKKGFWGWLGRHDTQVTAAVRSDGASRQRSTEVALEESAERSGAVGRFLREMEKLLPGLEEKSSVTGGAEVETVDEDIRVSPRAPALLAARTELYNVLTKSGVRGSLARRLVNETARQLPDELSMSETVNVMRRRLLSRMVRLLGFPEPIGATPDGKPLVSVFVGPTGVGKTTNIAKLAAHYALEHQWKVEVITTDMYRVAAVDQLAEYASLIGIPMQTAETPQEVRELVQESSADLILVDTAGRSHLDDERMQQLKEVVDAVSRALVFLCISLTSRLGDALDVVKRYRLIGFDRLFLTKLDETRRPGLYLNLRSEVNVPLSYVSVGQRVPDDVTEANAHRLAEQLLEVDAR